MTVALADIQNWLDETGMIRFMGIQAISWDAPAGQLVLRMPMRDELQGGAGAGHMHGGAIGALADTAATFVFLAAGSEQAPTANYRLDLLRPVVNSGLTATARIRRAGRTLGISDVDLTDDQDRLVAVARATFVLSSPSK